MNKVQQDYDAGATMLQHLIGERGKALAEFCSAQNGQDGGQGSSDEEDDEDEAEDDDDGDQNDDRGVADANSATSLRGGGTAEQTRREEQQARKVDRDEDLKSQANTAARMFQNRGRKMSGFGNTAATATAIAKGMNRQLSTNAQVDAVVISDDEQTAHHPKHKRRRQSENQTHHHSANGSPGSPEQNKAWLDAQSRQAEQLMSVRVMGEQTPSKKKKRKHVAWEEDDYQ